MEYTQIIAPYNDITAQIQSVYPVLLHETSDKELAQRLAAYNLYLDYHASCVQYIGVMIWAHQIFPLPPNGYVRYESYYRESESLLKHFRNLAPPGIVAHLDRRRRTALFDEIEALALQAFLTGTDEHLFEGLAGRAQGVRVEGAGLVDLGAG